MIGLTFAIISLVFIVKGIRRHIILKGKRPFIVSRILGIIIGEAVYCAFLLFIFAFIHGIVKAGGLPATDEVIRACPISGFIYKINPLNDIVEGTNIPFYVFNILTGNFNELAFVA